MRIQLFPLVLSTVCFAGHPELIELGTLGGDDTRIFDINADGAVVVGHGETSTGEYHAWVWTEDQGMRDLGGLSDSSSSANLVSADGTMIFGDSLNAYGLGELVIWEGGAVIRGLGPVGIDNAIPTSVSDSGDVVAGAFQEYMSGIESGGLGFFLQEAFRWTEESGIVTLGRLGRDFSFATGMSADGNVIIGDAINFDYPAPLAFRWNADQGMTSLGSLGGGISSASGVSRDGSTIIGASVNGEGHSEAFRWTEREGMVGLGSIGQSTSKAKVINSDGSVIAGYYRSYVGPFSDIIAFRWTESSGMQSLGTLEGEGGLYSEVTAMNADGTVLVGHSSTENVYSEAFRWTESEGMHTVTDWLRSNDVLVSDSVHLLGFDGLVEVGGDLQISADGNVIIGTGYLVTSENPEALQGTDVNLGSSVEPIIGVNGDRYYFVPWLARGSSGLITLDEFTQTFGTTASIQQTSLALPSSILNGAHHRVLLTQDFLDNENMVWVNGDFADHSRRDAEIVVGEVGYAYDFKPGLRGGIGVGYGELDQDLDL